MSWWMIYLWTRLNVVIGFSVILMIFSTVGLACSISGTLWCFDDEEKAFFKKTLKPCLVVLIVSCLSLLLVPSKDYAALIYVVPKMTQSETFKHIAESTPEITKLGLEVLQKELKELVDEKKGIEQ
jgi:hypothetical protein